MTKENKLITKESINTDKVTLFVLSHPSELGAVRRGREIIKFDLGVYLTYDENLVKELTKQISTRTVKVSGRSVKTTSNLVKLKTKIELPKKLEEMTSKEIVDLMVSRGDTPKNKEINKNTALKFLKIHLAVGKSR